MELDQAWMGKGAYAGHLAAPAAVKEQQAEDLQMRDPQAKAETITQGVVYAI